MVGIAEKNVRPQDRQFLWRTLLENEVVGLQALDLLAERWSTLQVRFGDLGASRVAEAAKTVLNRDVAHRVAEIFETVPGLPVRQQVELMWRWVDIAERIRDGAATGRCR